VSTDLRDRYGSPRTSRLVIVVAVVVALGLLAWLAWAIRGAADPEVTSGQTSYDIVGPHRATATFEVRLRSTTVTATCLLQAQAADHSVVGEANVVVPRDRGRTMTLNETVRTAREATLVNLVGCTTPTQKRPR